MCVAPEGKKCHHLILCSFFVGKKKDITYLHLQMVSDKLHPAINDSQELGGSWSQEK